MPSYSIIDLGKRIDALPASMSGTGGIVTTLSGEVIWIVDGSTLSNNLTSMFYDSLFSTSGDIIGYVTTQDNLIRSQLTTTSGDLVSWVVLQDYVTTPELTTASGDIISYVDAHVPELSISGTGGIVVEFVDPTWYIDGSGITGSGGGVSQEYVDSISGALTHTHVGVGGIAVTQSGSEILIDGSAIIIAASGTVLEGENGIVTTLAGGVWYVDGQGLMDYTDQEIATLSGYTEALVDARCTTISGLHGIYATYSGVEGIWWIDAFELWQKIITTSGDIISQIPIDYITQAELLTTSGDIVNQIPSLTGYATETWVANSYIDLTELTTTSGDIIAQMPSLIGYATQSWVTTVSGDIIEQIPSLVGYATESWVNNGFVSNSEMTTISGDLLAQMGSGEVTLDMLTTTSGDIIDYIDASLLTMSGGTVISGTGGIEASFEGGVWYIDGSSISNSGTGDVTLAMLTTTSGDIVSQIPSLAGYATESWVNTNFISNIEMTTISGDLVNRIPTSLPATAVTYTTASGRGGSGSENTSTTNAFPSNMTSDTTPSPYVASCYQKSDSGWEAYRAFSQTGFAVSLSPVANSWVQIYLGPSGGIVGNKWRWKARADTNAYNPKRFFLQGSNNGVDFTTIDTTYSGVDHTQITANTWSNWIPFTNYTNYTYYRLVNLSGYNATYVQVAGIEMVEAQYYTSSILTPSQDTVAEALDLLGSTLWSGSSWYLDLQDYIVAHDITTSGDIISQIPSLTGYATEVWVNNGFVSNAELTTTSGDIVAQIPSIAGYATESWVNSGFISNTEMTTISGNIVSQIPSLIGYVTEAKLTTVSGDIIAQVPSLVGYATESWVNSGFISNVEFTTASGDIIAQIPSLAGYATQSWANSTFIDTNEMTTISGDIVAQIGEGTGASESWVNDNFISNSEMTTISGDLVAQMGGGGEVTLEMLTTTSGDIIAYVDAQIEALPTGGGSTGSSSTTLSGMAGEALVKYDIVYQSSTDGKYYKATHSGTVYEADAVGIVTATSIAENTLGEITLEGQVTRPSWTWNEGLPIYVGESGGSITQTVPTASGYFAKPLGHATDDTTIWFEPSLGWAVSSLSQAMILTVPGIKGDKGDPGVGIKGDKGDTGATGPLGDHYTSEGTAGVTLPMYSVVYQDYSDSGKYKLANCNSVNTADACGLVTQSGGIVSDARGEITLWGAITYSGWNWIAGKSLYLDIINGGMTQDTPSGVYMKPLGRAITTSGIWWQPELGWLVPTVSGVTGSATVVGTNGTLHIEVEYGLVTVLEFT